MKQLYSKNLIDSAREEGMLKLKGDQYSAGKEIEKYLSVFRKEFAVSDIKYLDLKVGFEWCCAYVYFICVKAGIHIPIRPLANSKKTLGCVSTWHEWASENNKLIIDNPRPGDLVLFDKLLSEYELDHIGIILEAQERMLLTSEGNVNNQTGIFQRDRRQNINCFIRF